MTDLERIIAEMRDASQDEDEPTFHVGMQLRQWADRLAALAGAAPVAWMDSLLGNVSLPSEHVAGSNPAANGYIPLYTHAPAKAREDVCDDCQRRPCICMLACADDEADTDRVRRAVNTFIEHGGCNEFAHATMREKAMRAALATFAEGA